MLSNLKLLLSTLVITLSGTCLAQSETAFTWVESSALTEKDHYKKWSSYQIGDPYGKLQATAPISSQQKAVIQKLKKVGSDFQYYFEDMPADQLFASNSWIVQDLKYDTCNADHLTHDYKLETKMDRFYANGACKAIDQTDFTVLIVISDRVRQWPCVSYRVDASTCKYLRDLKVIESR